MQHIMYARHALAHASVRRRAAYARHTTDANLLLIQGLADVASSPRFRRIITISSRARSESLEIAM